MRLRAITAPSSLTSKRRAELRRRLGDASAQHERDGSNADHGGLLRAAAVVERRLIARARSHAPAAYR